MMGNIFWESKHLKISSVKCLNIMHYIQEIKIYSTNNVIVLYIHNIKPLHWLSWLQLKSQVQNSHIIYRLPDKKKAFKKISDQK